WLLFINCSSSFIWLPFIISKRKTQKQDTKARHESNPPTFRITITRFLFSFIFLFFFFLRMSRATYVMLASEYFNFYYYDYLIKVTIVSINGIGWVTKSHITLNNQCNVLIWA